MMEDPGSFCYPQKREGDRRVEDMRWGWLPKRNFFHLDVPRERAEMEIFVNCRGFKVRMKIGILLIGLACWIMGFKRRVVEREDSRKGVER